MAFEVVVAPPCAVTVNVTSKVPPVVVVKVNDLQADEVSPGLLQPG